MKSKEIGFNEVGYTDLEYEFEHLYPMYSLQKAFVGENFSPLPPTISDTLVTKILLPPAISLPYVVAISLYLNDVSKYLCSSPKLLG